MKNIRKSKKIHCPKCGHLLKIREKPVITIKGWKNFPYIIFKKKCLKCHHSFNMKYTITDEGFDIKVVK